MALDKGAQAVIFDVSDDANAAAEVSVKARLQTQLYTDIFIYEISMMKKAHRNVTFIFLCLSLPASVIILNVQHTAARNRLPSPSRRAGGGRGC